MKRFGIGLSLVLVLSLAAVAGSGSRYAATFPLGDGTVVVTNSQANSSWVPVAVLIRYTVAGPTTVEIRRFSDGIDVVIDTQTFANASSVVWVPTVDYPCSQGDALIITSTATNGAVQVIRRAN